MAQTAEISKIRFEALPTVRDLAGAEESYLLSKVLRKHPL